MHFFLQKQSQTHFDITLAKFEAAQQTFIICQEELTVKFCNKNTLRQEKTAQNSRILISETPEATETNYFRGQTIR